MSEVNNVPALRFPEFSGEWGLKTLGQEADFLKGKGISKSDIDENGTTECIRYGELYTHYSEVIRDIKSKTNVDNSQLVLSQVNDVVIPASGETNIDLATASCVQKADIALGGDLNIIRTNLNGIFLSYYLNNKIKHKIASLAQGVSVVHLYVKHLKSLHLNVPIEQEQQKIAAFLTEVDTKIEQLTQKQQLLQSYKKGVMQQLFSQEIRFKQEDGSDYPDWETKKIGSFTIVSTGGTPSTLKKEFWDNGNIRWMNSGELNLKKVFDVKGRITTDALNNSSTKLIPMHSILLGLAGQGKTRGTVAMNMVDLCVNQSIAAIYPKKEVFDEEFLYQNLNNRYEEIRRLSTGDGGRGGLNLQIIKSIKVPVPSVSEQTKISTFLSDIDNKISHVEKQIEGSKQYKQALLQQMFV